MFNFFLKIVYPRASLKFESISLPQFINFYFFILFIKIIKILVSIILKYAELWFNYLFTLKIDFFQFKHIYRVKRDQLEYIDICRCINEGNQFLLVICKRDRNKSDITRDNTHVFPQIFWVLLCSLIWFHLSHFIITIIKIRHWHILFFFFSNF